MRYAGVVRVKNIPKSEQGRTANVSLDSDSIQASTVIKDYIADVIAV